MPVWTPTTPNPTPTEVDNSYATTLTTLHAPGNPVVFANIYDPASAAALLSLNSGSASPVKAVATASYAIAASLGIADEDLSLEQNFAAIAKIAPLVRAAGLPLTADLQDGYGARLVDAIEKAVALGVVGANIEDSYPEKGFARGLECLRSIEEQVERIKLARKTAEAAGVKDFDQREDGHFQIGTAPRWLVAKDGAGRGCKTRKGVLGSWGNMRFRMGRQPERGKSRKSKS
ncbi:putative phosphoenolpyruvate phosphomutase [Lyophyllum shimeji]|uniref:Phosphoenolpyruvate phosphomutase n=1 Tax=Lyophyllum shimeji TaxID=47721 RepID=A0A9P3PW25_LYOSH|nr:putative phosphoenolpyruvate phosphomutase [Lyophyllum shimeji]